MFKKITLFLMLIMLSGSFLSTAQSVSPIKIESLTIGAVNFPNLISTTVESNRVSYSFDMNSVGDSLLPTTLHIISSKDVELKLLATGEFMSPPYNLKDKQSIGVENIYVPANSTYIINLGKFNYFRGIRASEFKIDVNITTVATPSDVSTTTRTTYYVRNENRPLPVTLTSFTAKTNGSGVKLDWNTAMEKDFDYFSLESSTDGANFKQINKQLAKGVNSNVNHNYSFTDIRNQTGPVYYRLRIYDIDRSSSYSSVQVVNGKSGINGNDKVLIQFGENYFAYDIPNGEKAVGLILSDMLGRTVIKQNGLTPLRYTNGNTYVLGVITTSGKVVNQLVR